MITHLRVGFVLRCFQHLSNPDIATEHAPGGTARRPAVRSLRSSRHVLPLFLGAQTISSSSPVWRRTAACYLYRQSLSWERFLLVQVRVSFNSSRYGVKPRAANNSSFVFFFFVT